MAINDTTITIPVTTTSDTDAGPLWQGILDFDLLRGREQDPVRNTVRIDRSGSLIRVEARDLLLAVWRAAWRDEMDPIGCVTGTLAEAVEEAGLIEPEIYSVMSQLGASRQQEYESYEEGRPMDQTLELAYEEKFSRVAARGFREEQRRLEELLLAEGVENP